ncbi:geranylgeranyl reductase family protein [Lacisediminihabitans sp. FW035]
MEDGGAYPARDDAASAGVIWDVLVVGAGPAGSSAARVAAAGGASVLLVDRARFPRYKTCGGGLIGISLAHLPDSVLSTVEQRTREVRFSLRGGSSTTYRRALPFLALVQRERFDEALVTAAVAAGASFRDSVVVRAVEEADGLVTVTTDGPTLRARVVIGADGTSGRIGRYVGVQNRGIDLALEVELTRTPESQAWDDSIAFDWGPAPGSYAWVFPKEKVLTVGVIQARGEPQQTRDYLESWLYSTGLDTLETERSSGHLTQWRAPDSPLRRGSVLVAGDAAGLLDPWTREGLSFALRSGCWAGDAAAAATTGGGSLDDYGRRVDAELEPDIRAGERLLRFFEKHPRMVHFALADTRTGMRLFLAVCDGTKTLGGILSNRVLSRALRVFGS